MKELFQQIAQLGRHIPPLHDFVWIGIACMMLYKLNTFFGALKEMCCEKGKDGQSTGKISSKRVIIFLFAFATIYVWIYSMHAGNLIDHYVFTCVILLVAFGLAIVSPEQVEAMADRFKSITTTSTTKAVTQNTNTIAAVESTTETVAPAAG